MKKVKIANGTFWVEIPEADLRILCGCPADAVKHLISHGLIAPVEKNGVRFETGPNAILLSDTPVQKGSFANLCEFPLLQMFYRQGLILPGHPNNTGRRPLLIGLGDQVRSQADYVHRGNYGLLSVAELEACGVPPALARELFAIKLWFSFGKIRATADMVDLRPIDADAVELAPGCIMHRKGFNRYEFIAGGRTLEVDLTLGPGEEFEPSYTLPPGAVRRHPFSVIHVGEGDGWDVTRPCMGSIVCGAGLLYLIDAGPHITRSLDALGIGLADVEGIFHTHGHDDHFSGLTTLVRSDRRLKYYAVPAVRESVQKKLSALMRMDERRFSTFFEVHDLVPGEWNRVGGIEVRPVYSPHPVETTILFFRSGEGSGAPVYAHLADIPSVEVLGRLAGGDGRPAAMSGASRDAFLKELSAPVALKKVDAGGGLIHGSASDFSGDASRRVVLSHGVADMPDRGARLTTTGFGQTDVLIGGAAGAHLPDAARALLLAWFPRCAPADIERLARSPIVEIPRGEIICEPSEAAPDVRLILSGLADQTDPAGSTRTLGVGSFAGGFDGTEAPKRSLPCRARGVVTVLSIPRGTWQEFLSRAGPGACRESTAHRDVLSLCPAFSGITTESVLYRIAASAAERTIRAGTTAPPEPALVLHVLARGEVDITVGSQLIETLQPGGFWGEERIVSDAPGLAVARAVTDCTCLVVPAEVLRDVPRVQWELLETFERRLRSFRAGFKFQWSESFRVDVALLDDQHQKLFAKVNALSVAIGHTGFVEGHAREKNEVLEYTRTHFADEEALLEAHGYPRLDVQRKAHAMLLRQLEALADAAEKRARPRPDTAVDYLKDWLISHTLLEDLQYRQFFVGKGVR